MQPAVRRRVIFIALYEVLAVAIVTAALAAAASRPATDTGAFALVGSAVAATWNYAWNWMFERWEARRRDPRRTTARRIAHAVGFETGLVVTLVPAMAWMLDMTLMQAFFYDLGLIVFFLFYTYAFTWAFDAVFGPPQSAQARGQRAS
ncbi:MAG: PACE efflux transporter [Rubrimonas sp.]